MREFDGIMAALSLSRAGSYRAAARETGQSFKTLNKRIQSLEEELGYPIFRTKRNGLTLTNEGVSVIAEAERIEKGITRLRRMAKDSLGVAVSEFTIATSVGAGTYWVMPSVASFQAKNPMIHLRFVGNNRHDSNAFGTADISIQFNEPVDPDIVRKKLARVHFILCASEEYVELNGLPSNLNDLDDHRFVLVEPGWFSQRDLIEAYIKRPLKPQNRVEVPHAAFHFLAVEHGVGIGMIPTFVMATSTRMRMLDIEIHASVDMWICYASEARQNPRLSLTIDWLIDLFEPRTNPWFRREFIHPRVFPELIDKMGLKEKLRRHKFERAV